MPPKSVHRYVCQSCGLSTSQWMGRCHSCGEWDSFIEETTSKKPLKSTSQPEVISFSTSVALNLLETGARLKSGIEEFDRACGGGLVPGAAILIGGDPGIGKSTLLLQVMASLSQESACLYVAGEEALSQIFERVGRLGLTLSQAHFVATTQLPEILQAFPLISNLKLVIIDSIQTVLSPDLESPPGSVGQIRLNAHRLIEEAKRHNYILILVGHITKEGIIAGPKVLEHMVDAVLYFEGDRHYDYRMLRTIKNRFGPTNEIGLFHMTGEGLKEIKNPSELFLSHHPTPVSGTSIFAGIEGTRAILCEIQVLLSTTAFGSPRRTTIGWDPNRLAMLLAVLETRCGFSFNNKDVYLNVVGGLKITEPAADLAVAVALISGLKNVPLPQKNIYFGEIGLAGEIRKVNHPEARLKEAQKLGFKHAVCRLEHRDIIQPMDDLSIRSLHFLQDFSVD